MGFTVKKINKDETVGCMLHTMRHNLNFTLDEMAERTKIQKKYLEAFEKDCYDILPEPLYAKHFLKTYVLALKGDADYILSKYEEAHGTCDLVEPMQLPRQKARAVQFLVAHKLFRVAVIAVLAIAVFGYLGHEIKSIVKPPEIYVLEPADELATDDAIITVSGTAEEESEIFVNGNRVLPAQDGSFSTEVILERGLNVITVEGSKRYSKTTTIYRRVILERDESRQIGILSTSMAKK